MIWTLSVCVGITWAGCGAIIYRDYPNEDSCSRALCEMKENSQMVSESDKKRSGFAVCAPKEKAIVK